MTLPVPGHPGSVPPRRERFDDGRRPRRRSTKPRRGLSAGSLPFEDVKVGLTGAARPQSTESARLAELFSDTGIGPTPNLGVRELFRSFWPFTRSLRLAMAAALVLAAITPVLDAAGLWLFKLLIDDVLTPRQFGPFPRIAALYVAITLALGIVGFVSSYLSAWMGERYVTTLRTMLFRHLHTLSLDFFERRRLGDILARLTGDVGAIESLVVSGVVNVVSYVLRIVLYAGVLIYLQWQLATAAMLVAPLFWLVSRFFSGRLKAASRENRRNRGAISAVAEESLANVALVQAYNRQDLEVDRFTRHNLASLRSQLRSTRLRGYYRPIIDLAELLGLLLVVGLGVWRLTIGELTLGELLVFLAYFAQLARPLRSIARLSTSVASASASAERIAEVLRSRPSVSSPTRPERTPIVNGTISLDAVRFRYPGQQVDALRDISVEIAAGETVAVVGPTGAGKSTLTKLLLRFYDPDAGVVRLGGIDVRRRELTDLRTDVALVMQETLVFDGTIRDNLLWARPEATPAELAAALTDADLAELISELPDGLDTRIGQRGRRLSGGQRQRLAIARALLRASPILLLDEPTTGLDVESANRVLAPMRRLMHGRTTLLVTHDLRTAQTCGRIIVMEAGRVVEQGSHHELIQLRGRYASMVATAEALGPPAPRLHVVGS